MNFENYQLINFWHDKKNNVVLKLQDKITKQIKLSEVKYPALFWINLEDTDKATKVLDDFAVVNSFTGQTSIIKFKFVKEEKYCRVTYEPTTTIWLKELIEKIQDKLDENEIKHYELDLWMGANLILNNKIEIAEDYRILYFDLETKDTEGGIEIGRDQILSICAVDNEGKEFKFCFDDEKTTLQEFVKITKNYDIMIGWNSKRFDVPYLVARCKINDVYFSKKELIFCDLMLIFMSNFAVSHFGGRQYITSYSLDNIAKIFIKDEKLKIKSGGTGYGGRLWDLFQNDREQLLEYNLQDCKLLKRLDEEYNLMSLEINVAKLINAPLSCTRSVSSIVDYSILRESRQLGLHFPSKRSNVTKIPYEGGLCELSEPGLYKNVVIWDFSSLYPSLVRLFNISPETLLSKEDIENMSEDEYLKTFDGYYFKKNVRGVFPVLLDRLTDLRFKLRDEEEALPKNSYERKLAEFKQVSVKLVILSAYGNLGSSFSRYYQGNVAASVTGNGRELLQRGIDFISTLDYCKWIYSDTDSWFISFTDLKDVDRFYKDVKSFIDTEVYKQIGLQNKYLDFKLEKIMDNFILLSKKKYCGRVIAE